MDEATNISLPPPQRVREILREVQDATVDGVVFARRGRGDYSAIPADEVRRRALPVQGVEVVGANQWLVYRLLHEYQPSTAPNRSANLEALDLTTNKQFYSRQYATLYPGHPIPGAVQEIFAKRFAQGDAALEKELGEALQRTASIQQPKRHYLIPNGTPATHAKFVRTQFAAALQDSMHLMQVSTDRLTRKLRQDDPTFTHAGSIMRTLVTPDEAMVTKIWDALAALQEERKPGEALPAEIESHRERALELARQATTLGR